MNRYIETTSTPDGGLSIEIFDHAGKRVEKFADRAAAQSFLNGLNVEMRDRVYAPGFDIPKYHAATPIDFRILWRDMAAAPRDGTLIDLNFDGIRHTDCHFERGAWCRKHSYPSATRVFFHDPTGWAPRPEGLVLPYHTNDRGDRYIP